MWNKEDDIVLIEKPLEQGHIIYAGRGRFCWNKAHAPKDPDSNGNGNGAQWKEELREAVFRLSGREILE